MYSFWGAYLCFKVHTTNIDTLFGFLAFCNKTLFSMYAVLQIATQKPLSRPSLRCGSSERLLDQLPSLP